MSVEKLNDELEFAASQGPGVAIMTTQETVRAVLAEVGIIFVTAHGDHITGERAVDLYDDELERCRRVSSELADCRAELETLRMLHASEKQAKIERGEMVEEMREVLEFYATADNYRLRDYPSGTRPIWDDYGAKARNALGSPNTELTGAKRSV